MKKERKDNRHTSWFAFGHHSMSSFLGGGGGGGERERERSTTGMRNQWGRECWSPCVSPVFVAPTWLTHSRHAGRYSPCTSLCLQPAAFCLFRPLSCFSEQSRHVLRGLVVLWSLSLLVVGEGGVGGGRGLFVCVGGWTMTILIGRSSCVGKCVWHWNSPPRWIRDVPRWLCEPQPPPRHTPCPNVLRSFKPSTTSVYTTEQLWRVQMRVQVRGGGLLGCLVWLPAYSDELAVRCCSPGQVV